MLALNLLDQVSINAMQRWQLGQQQQALLSTSGGKVFLFHGSTDVQDNLKTVVKYKQLIMKADNLICCHSTYFPQWVQAKCLTVGEGTVTVRSFGDCVMYITQN